MSFFSDVSPFSIHRGHEFAARINHGEDRVASMFFSFFKHRPGRDVFL